MGFVVPSEKYGWERFKTDLNTSVVEHNGTSDHLPRILTNGFDYDYLKK